MLDWLTGQTATGKPEPVLMIPRRNRRPLRWGLAPGILLGLAVAVSVTPPAGAQSLEEALATAYSSNPDLLAARAQLRSVNEGVPQALSNWRPQVTVSGSAGLERREFQGDSGSDTETTEPWEVGVGVTQSLYRGGRTTAETARAEAEVEAQRARLTATEQDVLLDAV
ncbi:MAG: TolC family protein, partial [Rhodospirillales bacterium]|nr:TolC family protein [Rhodospirillales bacterium]